MAVPSIPDKDSRKLATLDGRKELMQMYHGVFAGTNADGETVHLAISPTSIRQVTFQENGWTRVNWYDADGLPAGETFDGKWC